MSEKILYCQVLDPEVVSQVKKFVPEGMALEALTSGAPEEIAEKIATADYMIVATTPIGERELAHAKALKLIQHQGVGYDNIDMKALANHQARLALNTAGLGNVSDHAILLMLATYRRLPVAEAAMRRGEWLQYELRSSSRQMQGKQVGIIGFGRIGQETARKVSAFGVSVRYHDIERKPDTVEHTLNARWMPLDDLLASSDIVVLHLGLNAATRHIIGAPQLAMMKPDAILINTARGALVDEAALIDALENNRLLGAGLDVFEREPLAVDSPLRKLSNVVLTPHISAGTREVFDEKLQFAFDNIEKFHNGEEVLELVS